MERIARERGRLLKRFALWLGAPSVLVAVPFLASSAAEAPIASAAIAALLLLAALALWAFDRYRRRLPHLLFVVLCLAALVTALAGGLSGGAAGIAVGFFVGGAVSCTAGFALWGTRTAWLTVPLCIVVPIALSAMLFGTFAGPAIPLIAASSVVYVVVAALLWRAIDDGLRLVSDTERIHAAERRASELSYQRHTDARLLHDTVLATLSILAHAGTGVPEPILREQAAGDAQLLRRLRLGEAPQPTRAGAYVLENKTAAEQQSFAALRGRFAQQGLQIVWHGTGEGDLEDRVFTTLELALGACLENVRRHAGVTTATVTVTIEPDVVRAVVTDTGVGFDVDAVPGDRLGLRESVLGRVRAIGGTARVFSVPGGGTTVAMELPREGR